MKGGQALRSRREGFTLMEILVGFFILAIAFVSLGAYSSQQRKGLHNSNQLSGGTQAAVSALERMKADLADSARFASYYASVRHGSRTIRSEIVTDQVRYDVTLTLTAAPEPLYAIKVRGRVAWGRSHSLETGVLVPGVTHGL